MGTHRVNIINTLQLIADLESQAEYQRLAPWVNVACELVNQWFCDFYHPGSPQFEAEFSQAELASLAEFNHFYDERASSLPNSLSGLLSCATWVEVVKSAESILNANGWKSIVAKYES